jgi:hypothetical protein
MNVKSRQRNLILTHQPSLGIDAGMTKSIDHCSRGFQSGAIKKVNILKQYVK